MAWSHTSRPHATDKKGGTTSTAEAKGWEEFLGRYMSPATLLKMPVRLLPTAVNAPIAATAIKAAIKPYSIAVAPLSSFKSFKSFVRMGANPSVAGWTDRACARSLTRGYRGKEGKGSRRMWAAFEASSSYQARRSGMPRRPAGNRRPEPS